MTRIGRYIFRQMFWVMVSVAITLTGVVWLTQSLRFIDMIVNRGLSVPLFLYFTSLLLPTFLYVILPIALFTAILFIYNKLTLDRELVVLGAAGMSPSALSAPAMFLALIVTVICYGISLYLIPVSYREFKETQLRIRNNYSSVFLQAGVFNRVLPGVTVYVRGRSGSGELFGIIIHDNRQPAQPVTMMAERGALVTGVKGPRVLMVNGNRQDVPENGNRLRLLYFDRYTFDLGALNQSSELRWREPRERFLHQLFLPGTMEKDAFKFHKLRMEGHSRIVFPLYPITFAILGLACLLLGEFNRRGQKWRVLSAVTVVILIEASGIGFKNLGEKFPDVATLLYLNVIVPSLVVGYFLFLRRERRGSRRNVGTSRGAEQTA